ncbi:MAG TPA: hypothetical protein VET26_11835, partial [Candidatus Sulfotelmatobacter sp.]|nr:hypothetical protein [Candidatus Sulfotelmatobacter sp.]
MIAGEREDAGRTGMIAPVVALPAPRAAALAPASPRGRSWANRFSAAVLLVSLVSTLGGGEFVDSGYALVLQSRGAALHARWATMIIQGIPATDLAQLEQAWTYSQHDRFMGAAVMFWTPGARSVVDSWQAETDRIWTRDLSRYRADALLQEESLHRAIG